MGLFALLVFFWLFEFFRLFALLALLALRLLFALGVFLLPALRPVLFAGLLAFPARVRLAVFLFLLGAVFCSLGLALPGIPGCFFFGYCRIGR